MEEPANSNDSFDRIDGLRDFLQERPKNAKVTSQLACLLAERAKLLNTQSEAKDTTSSIASKTDGDLYEKLHSEAFMLAEKATKLAPAKPYGFTALSIVSIDFKDRINNLREAVDRCSSPQHVVARVGLLVRLLVEPREHESRIDKEKIGRSSPQHPSRRSLTAEEHRIYTAICNSLREAWLLEKIPNDKIEYLAKQEFRMGLFFRKKLPPETQRQRSKTHFRKVCEKLPSSSSIYSLAQFWLATLSSGDSSDANNDTVVRCPTDYIVGLYSTFASRFDNLLLQSLKYSTPTELRRLVDQVIVAQQNKPNQKWARKGLDLGCGTGLSGESFRTCVDHLTGVDLSPEMLAKAKLRSCYDELIVGECCSILSCQASFDLIVACDVFVYIGDLSSLFVSAYKSLASGGLFAFSTELLQGAQQETRYILHRCARFAHSKSYIEQLAIETGFEIAGQKICTIRKNEGKDVLGSLVVLRRP